MKLSVIIPCYNESANLKMGVLKSVYNYLKNQKFTWEVIISDDGSTDDSREIVKKEIKNFKNFVLLENPHGGKPSALRYAIKHVNGDYILFTDMDQSTPIDQLDKLLKFIDDGYDVIIGSRGIERKDFPFYRKLGGFVFSSFRRILILREIIDTQCGFKLFRESYIKKYFSNLEVFRVEKKVTGWKVTSFDVELLHILKKKGARIKEIVVEWKDKDKSVSKGGALEKYFKESKDMVMQILRVKLNDMRGLYD